MLDKKNKVIIIIALLILIIGVFFIAKSLTQQKPQMSIFIKFEDISPITRGFLDNNIVAYYRGYKVGKISNIKLSKDQQHIVLKLDIYYKDLRIPSNSIFEVLPANVLGQKFIDINYPKEPSGILLKDKDITIGKSPRVIKDIDEFFEREIRSGRIEKLTTNLDEITTNIKELLHKNKDEINSLIKSADSSAKEINKTISGVRNIVETPEIKQNIKQSIEFTKQSLEFTKESAQKLNKILSDKSIQETITRAPELITSTTENLEKISKELETTDKLMCNTNHNLEKVNCAISKIPEETLKNADKTVQKVECLSDGLSNMLSKRFLLFRFIFGKPGQCFENCKPNSCQN